MWLPVSSPEYVQTEIPELHKCLFLDLATENPPIKTLSFIIVLLAIVWKGINRWSLSMQTFQRHSLFNHEILVAKFKSMALIIKLFDESTVI